MFTLFFLLLKNKNTFIGYWDDTSNLTNVSQNDQSMHQFQINYEILENKTNIVPLKSAVFMLNGSVQVFRPKYSTFYGFYNKSNSICFLVYVPSTHKPLEIAKSIISAVELHHGNYSHISLHNLFVKMMKDFNDIPVSILFKEKKGSNKTRSFFLNSTAIGSGIINTRPFYFVANRFDILSYQDELRVFAVFYGIAILLYFFINMKEDNMMTNSDYIQVYHWSVAMSNAFDYTIFLTATKLWHHLENGRMSYLITDGLMLYTFFMFMMPRLTRSMKARAANETAPVYSTEFTTYFYMLHLFLYSYQLFSTFGSSQLPWSLIMSSFWVPQILYSALKGRRNTVHLSYAFSISLFKILIFAYLLLYPKAIINSYSPVTFYVVSAWISLQLFVIYLQSKLGCDFFLPSHMKKVPFDYYAHHVEVGSECPICMCDIQEGELAVTTPCGHVFHDACLRRWGEEQMVCPVCRANLPEFSQPVNL